MTSLNIFQLSANALTEGLLKNVLAYEYEIFTKCLSFYSLVAVFDKCKSTYETDISSLLNCDDFPDSENPDVCSTDPFKRKYLRYLGDAFSRLGKFRCLLN